MSHLFRTSLRLEDFANYGWGDVIELADRKTCLEYSRLFAERARELDQEGSYSERDVCFFFAAVTSFFLRLDTPKDPFSPEWTFAGGQRSTIPSDFPEALWDLLLNLLPQVEDPELLARCADILWILRKGDYRTALIAITAYLRSARRLHDPEKWVESGERIERAQQLALQLGRKGDHFDEVTNYIESLLGELGGTDPLWFSHRLMSLLLKMRVGDPFQYAALCQEIVQKSINDRYWDRVRAYEELRAQWLTKAKLLREARSARQNAAESYVFEAQDLQSKNPPDYMQISRVLSQAVEALRQCGAPPVRIQEVHKILLESQEKSLNSMQSHSFSVDLESEVKKAIEAVREKPLAEAILILARNFHSRSVESLRQEVELSRKNSPLYWLAMVSYMDERGRVKARRSGLNIGEQTDGEEEAIKAEMYHRVGHMQGVKVAAILDPILHQISLDHHARIDDLLPFVVNNPFVPPHHELIYAQGLFYGLIGEFALSTALLVPQIENSIRYLLNQHGVLTSSLDSDGVAEDWDLGRLLHNTPELTQVFDEDLLFDLQSLLVQKTGSNLRNEFAHGKLAYAQLNSSLTAYFWWLTLYLCCYPTLQSKLENQRELTRTSTDDHDSITLVEG